MYLMRFGPTYVSVREAASLLEMSQRLVRRFLRHNRIKGARREHGRWLIPVPVEFVSGDATQDMEQDFHGLEELEATNDLYDDVVFALGLSPEEAREIALAAQRDGLDFYAFLRQAALDKARGQSESG